MNILLNTDIDKEIQKTSELIDKLNEANQITKTLKFISIKEFCNLTGWSLKTVQNLYNRKDFPSTDFGKEKKAEVHAIIEYFKIPRRRRD